MRLTNMFIMLFLRLAYADRKKTIIGMVKFKEKKKWML